MTANPNVHPGTLSCGCRRGHYLCAEGQRLWNEVGRAYDRVQQCKLGTYEHNEAWTGYFAAQHEYDMHFEEAG